MSRTLCHFLSVWIPEKCLGKFTAIVDLGEGLLRVWDGLPKLSHMLRMQRRLWELYFDLLCLGHTFHVLNT